MTIVKDPKFLSTENIVIILILQVYKKRIGAIEIWLLKNFWPIRF